MIKVFGSRDGSLIDQAGESRLARSDGSVTTVPKTYWPELAEATRENKAALGQPSAALIATDALRESLTARSGHKGKRTATRQSMRFGTRVWYARFHAGGTKGTRGIPKRDPLIPIDVRTRRRMVDEVRRYLLSKRRGLEA